jgi:diguanylate cyclase (GGDEF)-like protein
MMTKKPQTNPESNVPAKAEAPSNAEHIGALESELRRVQAALEAAQRDLQTSLAREKYLTRVDSLTGVNNRRTLYELADHEFDVAMRYQHPLAAIMFDLDKFEQFGRTIGDQLLELVAQAACAELRSADVIGRYGGDEFIILLPVTNAQQAQPVAERIRASVAAIRLPTEQGQAASLTASFGIAEIRLTPPRDDTVEDIVRRADEALGEAKQTGRNCVVVFAEKCQ